jgi:hypothetical protein
VGPAGQQLWLMTLVAYFFFGLVNGWLIGLTPDNERLNGLAQIIFFWSPAVVSMVLLKRAQGMKRKLFMGLVAVAAVWFAAFPTILSGAWNMLTKGYNPDVKLTTSETSGDWRICHYHFSPSSGFGEDNDFSTREKPVFPGIKIVRKSDR